MKTRILLGFLAVCLLVGPGVIAQTQFCNVTYTDILYHANSGFAEEEYLVIDNEADWCAVWDIIYARQYPKPACDTAGIDFDNEVALVAAIGQYNNTCHSGRIVCVRKPGRSSNLQVIVEHLKPGNGCVCGQAIVYPVHVVKVDKPVSNANFITTTNTYNCFQLGDPPDFGKF